GQLAADGQLGVQARGGVLEDHGHARAPDAVQRTGAQADQFGLAQPDRAAHAGGRRQQPQHGHGADGLAGAGLAGQPLDPPGREVQGDALDHLHRIVPAEGDSEVADAQRAHRPSSVTAVGSRPAPWGSVPPAAPSRSAEERVSSASRRESPMKLNDITTVRIARPGNTPSHQASMWLIAPEIIEPHSAVGGWAPSPRKDRPVSSRIAVPMSREASTITGPAMLGRMSLRSERQGE